MGDEIITLIIQAAEEMRAHGHTGQLVAVLGLGVNDGGLGEVSTTYGKIKVFAQSGLVAPNSIEVMTEDNYFRQARELASRGK